MKKIIQISALIFLTFWLVSCDEGCVGADEFDTEVSHVNSSPVLDGISGSYDAVNGGQKAEWHETGLRSNGKKFIIQVSGGWTPWNGTTISSTEFKNLPECNYCAKKPGVNNCICYPGVDPVPEIGIDGAPVSTATGYCDATKQADPALCTCTKQSGSVTDNGVYQILLNAETKNKDPKNPDDQSACLITRGIGLYIGLFGFNGVTTPSRTYELFSPTEVCDITRRASDNKCIDDTGNDRTKFIYTSANNRIFMKDDKNGNDGTDTNTADDKYHDPNEQIKLVILDTYYSDNYGSYNVTFLQGVGDDKDRGLLEFMVRLVEDALLGPINSDNVREGGVMKVMYNGIVQDPMFINIVRVLLALYISFYGLAILFGLAEIDRKELTTRLLKIGLIVFFTSKTSWAMYQKFVVGLFKDSMDYVIGMIMSLSEKNQDPTSMIAIAQMDRANSLSNATRFSYIDTIIKRLFSMGAAKKIFGLFFGSALGLIYIPVIYALIGFFVYTMLFVAMAYLVNVMKIIFGLCLGPIFICFTLFSKTNDMFKKWLAFLGARSLEIIIMFMVLYNFLLIIDKGFNDLLYYKTCVTVYNIGLFSIPILRAEVSRSIMEWFSSFITIGGLIFMTRLILDKVPSLSGSLISIGGVANKDGDGKGHGQSGFSMAGGDGGIMSDMMSAAKSAVGAAASAAAYGGKHAINAGTWAARKSGIADKFNAIGQKIPFRGARTRVRDSIIDGALKEGQREAAKNGLTGKQASTFARQKATAILESKMIHDPKKMAFAGVDSTTIDRRLDQKLIREPVRDFLKAEAKKLTKESADKIPLGSKAIREELQKRVEAKFGDMAESYFSSPSASKAQRKSEASFIKDKSLDKLLNKISKDSSNQLKPKDAVKKFGDNADLQNKYLDRLKHKEFKRHQKDEEAAKRFLGEKGHEASKLAKGVNLVGQGLRKLGKGYDNLMKRNDIKANPKLAQEQFMRDIKKQQDKKEKERLRSEIAVSDMSKSAAQRKLPLTRDEIEKRQKAKSDLNPFQHIAAVDRQRGKNKQNYENVQRELLQKSLRDDANMSASKKAYLKDQLGKILTKDVSKEMKKIAALEKSAKLFRDDKVALFNPRHPKLRDSVDQLKNGALNLVRSPEDKTIVPRTRKDAEALQAQADAAKQRLLERVAREVDGNRSSGPRSLEEVTARMDYIRQKFGGGEKPDISTAAVAALNASSMIKEETSARVTKAEADLAQAKAYLDEVKQLREENTIAAKEIEKDRATINTTAAPANANPSDPNQPVSPQDSSTNPATTSRDPNDPSKAQAAQDPNDPSKAQAAQKAAAQDSNDQPQAQPNQTAGGAPSHEGAAASGSQTQDSQTRDATSGAASTAHGAADSSIPQDQGDDSRKAAAPESAKDAASQTQDSQAAPSTTIPEKSDATKAIESDIRDRESAMQMREERAKEIEAKAKEILEKLQEATKSIDKIEQLHTKLDPEKPAGLMATDFKVEFGASISDVLLKSPDIGLKGSNVLLGISEGAVDTVDKAALAKMKMSENQVSGKLKMAKLNQQVKEMEIQSLKAKGDLTASEKDKLQSLEREVKDLENDVKKCEMDKDRIEGEMKEMMK